MFLLFETSEYDVNLLIYKCKIAVTIDFDFTPFNLETMKAKSNLTKKYR
jgi:hypothetical protein